MPLCRTCTRDCPCPCLASWLSFCSCSGHPRDLHSFPTRRSSDLSGGTLPLAPGEPCARAPVQMLEHRRHPPESIELDRKSTRLNSSHLGSSYAVFCLK